MATFPALIPSSRTFTAATYPGAVQLAYSGRESRVRTSNAQTGARFRLAFSALSEAEMLSIRDHYYGQLGRFIPFQLSTELLSGMANPSAVTPAGYKWIYVSSPKVTDLPIGTAQARSCRHDVELELELVPEVSALVSGANWVAVAAMTGGAGNGGEILVSGATWLAAAAIAGGAAGGGAIPAAVLLHMEGTNGSTTFTDSSANARTITAYGDAQISTAQAKFGSSSAYFDGTGDRLQLTGQSLITTFTIECFARFSSFTDYRMLFDSRTGDGDTSGVVLGANSSGQMFIYLNGFVIAGGALSTNTWYHVALTCDAGNWKIWVNGSQIGSTYTASLSQTRTSWRIGMDWAGIYGMHGYIDEFRVTPSTAIYSATFTPPTAAFPDS